MEEDVSNRIGMRKTATRAQHGILWSKKEEGKEKAHLKSA